MANETDAIELKKMFEQAYRKAGALKHPGQGISPSESAEALLVCNMMVNGWKIENLLVVYYKRTLVNFVGGQKNYSVGPGQEFDIERVEKIPAVGRVLNSGLSNEAEIPLMVVLAFDQYQRIIAKNTPSTWPLVFYYKALVDGLPGNVPYGEATLWPAPSADGVLALYSPVTLNEFTAADQTVYMPKGYQEMLTYNLAVRIHENYPDRRWDERRVNDAAAFYKERVKNMQMTPILMTSDAGALGGTTRPPTYGFPKTWTPYGS